jgi:hypothetical protein
VAEGDPPQVLDRPHAAERLGDEREQAAGAGVEQQGFLAVDEELVEHEVGFGDVGRDAVDAASDLVDACVHDDLECWWSAVRIRRGP